MSDTNTIAPERLAQWRREIEQYFIPQNAIAGSLRTVQSPSGLYRLEIQTYRTTPKSWNYSRGQVFRTTDNTLRADIKRNFDHFWYAWVSHPNQQDYLLCDENYQGYSVVNLTQGTAQAYLPPAALDGLGFCWVDVIPSPDGQVLAVEGCIWACPYDLLFVDFSQPENLPLPVLQRFDGLGKTQGWETPDIFAFTQEFTVRRADGVKYDDLTLAEQDELDSHPALMAEIEEPVRWTRPVH